MLQSVFSVTVSFPDNKRIVIEGQSHEVESVEAELQAVFSTYHLSTLSVEQYTYGKNLSHKRSWLLQQEIKWTSSFIAPSVSVHPIL